MKDPRLETLAKNLVNYSLGLREGEQLYLEVKGRDTLNLAREVVTEATRVGAMPFLVYSDSSIIRRFLRSATKRQVTDFANMHLEVMKRSQAYLGIRGDDNFFDLADVPVDTMKWYNEEHVGRVHIQYRVEHTRWCVLRYPSYSFCTLAEKSQESFEDFFFNVCNLDYGKLSHYMMRLKELMERTKKVRLKGPGTDLTLSIEGIPVIQCDGKLNIPDGEVFTAPQKTSVNGVIQYNTPALHDSVVYNNIRLEFKDGKIVRASCDSGEEKVNKILSVDEGARYVGEFAIGVNPFILDAMKDTLFDEKIWGSIHLTPGNCYDKAPNGNKSSLHWDLVLIQTPRYGGGEMYFDDVLVRKDGEFVHPLLKDFRRDVFV